MADNSNNTSVGNDTRHGEDVEARKPQEVKNDSHSKQKLIRLMTVMAYMMSVSMIAVTLSLYYIFLWNPKGPKTYALVDPCPECYDPSPKPLNFVISKAAAEDVPVSRSIIAKNLTATMYKSNNYSTLIPEVDRVETPLALALNIVLTTPLTETTTEYYEEEDLDTNLTTPLSQEPGFS